MAHRDLTGAFMEKRRLLRKRNRTSVFLDVQNKYQSVFRPLKGDISEEKQLLKSNEPPPPWTKCLDEINTEMKHLQVKMEYLSKAHTKRLMVRFDGSEETHDLEIDSLTQEITDHFRQCEFKLKRITRVGTTGKLFTSNADRNVRINIQRSLASKLKEVSIKFRKSQKEYLSRVQAQKQSGHVLDFLGSNTNPFDESDQEMMMDATELIVEERDHEIQRIARSISELSRVFKELAGLVIDQGTVVDRIDYNMEQVVLRMHSGLKELYRAERYQKSTRAMRCMSLLIFLISCCFVLLVLKHTNFKTEKYLSG